MLKNDRRSSCIAAAESQDQMQCGFLLDIIVSEGSTVFQLLPSEDESLLIRRNALLILDLGLDIFDGVGRFNIEGNGLSGESLDEYLHCWDRMLFFNTV